MMKALFKEQGASLRVEILSEPEVTDFIDAHAAVLDSGFEQVKMSDKMRESLQKSDWMFSGIKTFHELNEAFPQLTDEDGGRKPFERFLNDVRKVDETYNRNYLRAEYNFAQASAEMAGKWERIEEDGDEYLLQYRTAGDDKVRPEHASLYGITLPPSDTFWDEYYPPNGWNCRCSVAQVRRDKFPQTDREEAFSRARKALAKDKKGMFRFNPGKQERTFPDYNPYTISKCKNCPKAKNLAAGIPSSELCDACAFIQKCVVIKEETVNYGKGTISVNKGVNPNDSDYDKLYSIAQFFAKNGSEGHLTPKMSRPEKFKYECIYSSLVDTKYERKCPDLLIDGKWYEHEGFVTTNPKNAFRNMLRDGLRQSCRLIIDRPELTMRYMTRSIYNRLKNGEAIEEVWLLNKDGSIDLLYKKTDG